MNITFTARHGRAPDDIREHAEKEVNRLKRYFDGIIDCNIILDYEKKYKIVEINIHVFGMVLSAEERSEDTHKAINNVIEKLERKLKKYKEKKRTHARKKTA